MFKKTRRHWAERKARRGFGQDSRGSTAVEFAIVAPVFLMVMFSIFEVGWFFFANSVVDATVGDAARRIKTGQVQKSFGDMDDKYDDMFADICKVLDTFGDCDDRLTIEVDTFDSFTTLAADNTPATCADAPPDDLAAIPFNPGDELQIVRVRICYLYRTLNPAIGLNLAEPGTNKRRLISTAIFRNEPYELNNRDDD